MRRTRMEDLVMPCSVVSGTRVEVVFGNALIGIAGIAAGRDDHNIVLDELEARQLFNQLGVWLHLPKG